VGRGSNHVALANDMHWTHEETRGGVVATCRVGVWAVQDPCATVVGQFGTGECGTSSVQGVSKAMAYPTPPVLFRSLTCRRCLGRGRKNE
jgi:hypothetical protein